MSDLIWLDNEPKDLRTLTHYVYTDSALEALVRDGAMTRRERDALRNRVFPGLALNNHANTLYLYGPRGCVEVGMSAHADRNRALRSAHPEVDRLWSRGTSTSRVQAVDMALAPWAKPVLRVKDMSVKQLRKALKATAKAHRKDVQTIGREFLAEANRRGLCAEYDSVIQRINGGLTVKMPTRVRFVVEGTLARTEQVAVTVASDATDEEVIAAALAQRSDLTEPRVVSGR